MQYVVYKDGEEKPQNLSTNNFKWSGLTSGKQHFFHITVRLMDSGIEVPGPFITITESTKSCTGIALSIIIYFLTSQTKHCWLVSSFQACKKRWGRGTMCHVPPRYPNHISTTSKPYNSPSWF